MYASGLQQQMPEKDAPLPARRQSNTTSGLRWCRSSMSLPSPAIGQTCLSDSLVLDTLSHHSKGAAPLAKHTPH